MELISSIRSSPDRGIVFLAIIACVYTFGVHMAILGPSLVDLMHQTHTPSLRDMSFVLVARAAGGITSALIGKWDYMLAIHSHLTK